MSLPGVTEARRAFKNLISQAGQPVTLTFEGDLGAAEDKTLLTSALVHVLSDGEMAALTEGIYDLSNGYPARFQFLPTVFDIVTNPGERSPLLLWNGMKFRLRKPVPTTIGTVIVKWHGIAERVA